MAKKITVYIDQFQGEALSASWEAVALGRKLADQVGGTVQALVIGAGIGSVAQEAIQYGADSAVAADDASLADYRAEAYAAVVAQQAAGSNLVLFPTSTRGRELAAMAAIDLNSGVISDVTALELDGDAVVATKPVYAGKLLATVVCKTAPQIVTLRGRAFGKREADASRTGEITTAAPVMAAGEIKTSVKGYTQSEGGVSLTDAGVIVSGGRGVSNNPGLTAPAGMDDKAAEIWRAQQGFQLVGELAEVLGGAVGASRAAVDAGYIPYKAQVGQTGKVVSPDLYIAAGISGAIQHQAGMRTSKVIVAVNKDSEAPIFKLARYGVVGDLFTILPALTAAFKQRLGK